MNTFAEEDAIEKSVFTEYYDRKARLKDSVLPKNFDLVPEKYSSLSSIHCEIVKASAFDGDALYVDYLVDIPRKDWHLREHHSTFLSGHSQVAHCAPCPDSPQTESNFSFPIEFFAYRKSVPSPEHIPEPISICFKVSSVNAWDRYMVEGYGVCQVPSNPGSYEFDLEMWKPCGNATSRMKSFFLGGSPEIQDLSYLIQRPSRTSSHGNDKLRVVNKYGFHTETSGRLTIRFNVMVQKQISASLMTSVETGISLPNPRIKSISDALMRAKARLEAFRAKEMYQQP